MGFLDVITSPVASAIGSLVNGISNYFSTKETNRTNAGINASNIEFNREEAQKSRDWSEKMWNQENEYNSPANQLKLLRDAGLNPVNFETSISPAGTPPSGAQASAPSSIPMQSTNFGVINSLAASQADLANAQAENLRAKTKTENVTRDGVVRLNESTYQLNIANKDLAVSTARKMDADKDAVNASIAKMAAETKLIGQQGQFLQKEIDSYSFKLRSYLEEAASRTHLNIRNADEVASKIALNVASAQSAYASAALSGEQAKALELVNFLDGCKMNFLMDNQDILLDITKDSVITDWLNSSNNRAEQKGRKKQIASDEKMYVEQNDRIIAFLRALGSAINFGVSKSFK